MSSTMMMERSGMGMPGMPMPGMPMAGMPGMSGSPMGTTAGMTPTNFMMVPRCTIKVEKCTGGMKLTCVCDDAMARGMVQNLCAMLAGGMCSCCCLMNGMMVSCCSLTMGMCSVDTTEQGVCITCTSGDAQCCQMIQACCDCLSGMIEAGCTCCVMMNNTPVCCGVCDPKVAVKSKR